MSPAVAAGEERNYRLTTGQPLSEIYLEDQLNCYRNVTDLRLVCPDGHISVHRYILMASSPFLHGLLIDRDPSDLAVIHLDDVEIRIVTQIMSLIYTGNAIVSANDQIPIFSAMNSLGVSTRNILFRPALSTDDLGETNLRFTSYGNVKENQPIAEPDVISSNVNKKLKNNQRAKLRLKPRKAAEVKLPLPNVVLPGTIFTNENVQCLTCLKYFDNETNLISHITKRCGAHFSKLYVYEDRRCLICKASHVAENIWGLINHVKVCTTQGPSTSTPTESPSSNVVVLPKSDGVESETKKESEVPADVAVEASEEIDLNKAKKKRKRRRIAAYNTTKRRKPKKKAENDEPSTPVSSSAADPEEDEDENSISTPEETLRFSDKDESEKMETVENHKDENPEVESKPEIIKPKESPGREFLRTAYYGGQPYHIFCSSGGDRKKIIAIPASLSTLSNGNLTRTSPTSNSADSPNN